MDDLPVVVQGYGQVGRASAHIAQQMGARIVAVSDAHGGIHAPRGVDLDDVDRWIAEHRWLNEYPRAEHVTNAEILELPCQALLPAAVEHQITEANADRIQARIVVEGANGPTTLEADAILNERGVYVVPDILANAGGVTVSYFEWLQGIQHFFWTEEEVNTKLISLMQHAFRDVVQVAADHDVDLRTAALIRGVGRIAEAKRRRGIFP
jgi:glutamate dehydrogenase (NAD(P)+)